MGTNTASGMSDLVDTLRGLGFTDYEAQAYIALLRESPVTAYQVGKHTGLPRANVYAALETLAKKGAAQPVTENPIRYVPVRPEVLFPRMQTGFEAQCRRAAEMLAEIDRPDHQEHVWSLRGTEAIHGKIASMIESASQHVWIKAHERLLRTHRPALLAAAESGIQVILIVFGDPSVVGDYPFMPPSKIFMHENNGIEVGLGSTLVTVAIDFTEALTVNTAEGGVGAHTRSLPVVTLAESLIRHEIYVAEIFSRFEAKLNAEFGPALLRLRQHYLPAAQAAALDRLLADRHKVTRPQIKKKEKLPEGNPNGRAQPK